MQHNLNENDVNFDRLNILHFYSNQFSTYQMSNASKLLLQATEFNLAAPTIIFIHGFNNLPNEPIMKLMARNYLKKNSNFLSYDVSSYTKADYFKSVRLARPLAKILSDFIMELINEGLGQTRLHLIGFSLGAQIASFTGKYLKDNEVKLSRITGLDPTSACFSLSQDEALNKDDAEYVDVIHTSLISFSDVSMGHADYYINGRSGIQPGCSPLDIPCNHGKSLEMYTKSIQDQFSFPAKKCIGQLSFSKNTCIGKITGIAGHASSSDSRGMYYVKTNFNSPNTFTNKNFT